MLKMRRKLLKSLWNERGLGLTESMLAMTVLMIATLAIGTFITYQKQDQAKVGAASSCQEVLNWATNNIKSRDNKQNIVECFPWNYDPLVGGASVPTNYRCASLDIDPTSTADNFVQVYDPAWTSGVGNPNVRGWKNGYNIQNATQRIVYLMHRKENAGASLCANNDWVSDPLITSEFGDPAPIISKFANPKLWFKVTRLTSGVAQAGCRPSVDYAVRPRGIASAGGAGEWENDSFQVDVKFDYTERGISKTCSRSTAVAFDGDSTPPVIMDLNGGTNSATLTDGNGNYFLNTAIPTSCVKPSDPNTRVARLDFKVSKPGSVFECQRKDAQDTGANWATTNNGGGDSDNWVECTQLDLIAGKASTRGVVYRPGSLGANTNPGYPQGSFNRLEFRDLDPDVQYEMALRAVDPAGNAGSTQVAYLSWYIDESRPNPSGLHPDGVVVGAPGDNLQGSLWGAGDHNPGGWGTYYQCDQKGAPIFTVGSNDGWVNEGCIWTLTQSPTGGTVAVTDSNNGSCVLKLNPPNGGCFKNGTYTLKVDYYDVCGDAPGTQSITWVVDREDISSANITGGAYDNGNPAFMLTASGPQGIVWEMQGSTGLPIVAPGSSATITGSSIGYPGNSCTGPGNTCAVAYGACGSVKRASNTYVVRGALGDHCGGIECTSGLTCSHNVNSGRCVVPDNCNAPGGTFCTRGSDCSNDYGPGDYSASCDGHGAVSGICGCGGGADDSCCDSLPYPNNCRANVGQSCADDGGCNGGTYCQGYSGEVPGQCHCETGNSASGDPGQPVCPNFTTVCASAPADRGGLAPQCGSMGSAGPGCAEPISMSCSDPNATGFIFCTDEDVCDGVADTCIDMCQGPGIIPQPTCSYGCGGCESGNPCNPSFPCEICDRERECGMNKSTPNPCIP